jgi:hypothetical protein
MLLAAAHRLGAVERVRPGQWVERCCFATSSPLTVGNASPRSGCGPTPLRSLSKSHRPMPLRLSKPLKQGFVDKSWAPVDLLVLLFGIGLACAQFPDPQLS